MQKGNAGAISGVVFIISVYIMSFLILLSMCPDWITGGFGSMASSVMGLLSSCFFIFFPPAYSICRGKRNNQILLQNGSVEHHSAAVLCFNLIDKRRLVRCFVES